MEEGYTISHEWKGKRYTGLTNYIQEGLIRFSITAKEQFTETKNTSPLSQDGKKYIQEVVGTLLYYYYSRGVD